MSKKTTFIKLKTKLITLIILVVLITMLPSTYFSSKQQATILKSEIKERARKIARSAGAMALAKSPQSLGEEINWEQAQQFTELVYQLKNPSEIDQLDKNILYIIVVDKNGNMPVAEINKSLVNNLLKDNKNGNILEDLKQDIKNKILKKTESKDLKTLKSLGDIYPITINLEPEEKYIGTMEICFSFKEINDKILQKWKDGIYNTIMIIIIGIFVSVFISTMITKPINLLADAMQKVEKGDFSHEVNVKSHDELGLLAQTFNFMTKGLLEREKLREERDKIKSTFSKYVSPQVVNRILEENIPTGGEKKKVTVLFSDIRGFTPMSEKMEPHEIIALLNEYFSSMVDIVFKYEGTLDKYIGDAMMAEFGAPITGPNDALKAVITAVEMQRELSKLNEIFKKRGKAPISMGIGINTGEVVAGNMGSEKRMEYTVLGDNVNLASRLCGVCSGGQILISEATYFEVYESIEAKKLDPITVKGKSKPVTVYEVKGISAGVNL